MIWPSRMISNRSSVCSCCFTMSYVLRLQIRTTAPASGRTLSAVQRRLAALRDDVLVEGTILPSRSITSDEVPGRRLQSPIFVVHVAQVCATVKPSLVLLHLLPILRDVPATMTFGNPLTWSELQV